MGTIPIFINLGCIVINGRWEFEKLLLTLQVNVNPGIKSKLVYGYYITFYKTYGLNVLRIYFPLKGINRPHDISIFIKIVQFRKSNIAFKIIGCQQCTFIRHG